jgi:hypothetical protein
MALHSISYSLAFFVFFPSDIYSIYISYFIFRFYRAAANYRAPLTNKKLTTRTLTPNHLIKRMISKHRQDVNERIIDLCKFKGKKMPEDLLVRKMRQLLSFGALPDSRDKDGNSLVMLLMQYNRQVAVRMLLVEYGAPMLPSNDDVRSKPLVFCCAFCVVVFFCGVVLVVVFFCVRCVVVCFWLFVACYFTDLSTFLNVCLLLH